MSRYIKSLLFVQIVLINVASGAQNTSIKEESDYLVFSFVESANQIEGADLAADPFSRNDVSFNVSLSREGYSKEKYSYSYRPPQNQGYPHHIDVVVESGINENIQYLLSKPLKSRKQEFDERILEVMEVFRDSKTILKNLPEYVSVDNYKITRRWKEPYSYVYDFRKVNENKYQILFCPSFNSDELLSLIEGRQEGIQVCLDSEQMSSEIAKACYPFISDNAKRLSEKQTFFISGEISNDELLKYYKTIEKTVTNEISIDAVAYRTYTDKQGKQKTFMVAYFGSLECMFPFHSLVIEKVDGQWKALRSLSLQCDPIRLCHNSFDSVSFREKVSTELITEYADTLQFGSPPEKKFLPDKTITNSDILYISEVALRLRGIEDYCDFRIDHYNSHEIEVIIGRDLCKSLNFQKHRDKWILVDYGTCFY